MINLQKLIDDKIDEKAKATEKCLYYHTIGLYRTAQDYNERAKRIALHIQKLTLLLNAETQTTVKTKQHDGNASVS